MSNLHFLTLNFPFQYVFTSNSNSPKQRQRTLSRRLRGGPTTTRRVRWKAPARSGADEKKTASVSMKHYFYTRTVWKHARTRSCNLYHFEDQGQPYLSNYKKIAEMCGISHNRYRNNMMTSLAHKTYCSVTPLFVYRFRWFKRQSPQHSLLNQRKV